LLGERYERSSDGKPCLFYRLRSARPSQFAAELAHIERAFGERRSSRGSLDRLLRGVDGSAWPIHGFKFARTKKLGGAYVAVSLSFSTGTRPSSGAVFFASAARGSRTWHLFCRDCSSALRKRGFREVGDRPRDLVLLRSTHELSNSAVTRQARLLEEWFTAALARLRPRW